MTLSEFEISRCEKLVAEFIQRRRPPPHLRDKVDLAFRINGQSIEIFEVRADWRDAGKKIEQPFAKATYNKSRRNWKIFRQRADLNGTAISRIWKPCRLKNFWMSSRKTITVVSSAKIAIAVTVHDCGDSAFNCNAR